MCLRVVLKEFANCSHLYRHGVGGQSFEDFQVESDPFSQNYLHTRNNNSARRTKKNQKAAVINNKFYCIKEVGR